MKHKRTVLPAIAMMAGLLANAVGAAPGDIDGSYGAGGQLFFKAWDATYVPMPDGSGRVIEVDRNGDSDVLRTIDGSGRYVPGRDMKLALPEGTRGFFDNLVNLKSGAFEASRVFAAPDGGLLIPFLNRVAAGLPTPALIHLRPDGSVDQAFGGNGRGYATMATTADAFAVMPDGRITFLESHGAEVDDNCTLYISDPVPGEVNWSIGCSGVPAPSSVARLLADGRPDTTFGGTAAEKVVINTSSAFVKLAARSNGSVVVVTANATVYLISADGGSITNARVPDMVAISAALMPDDSLIIVGMRPGYSPYTDVLVARLDSALRLDPRLGNGTGVEAVAIGRHSTGRNDMGSYVRKIALAPDASHLYMEAGIVSRGAPDYHCFGVASLSLGAAPALDDSFGRGGFSCLFRSGWYPNRSLQTPVAQPVSAGGGVLVSGPSATDGGTPVQYRVSTGGNTGPGIISPLDSGSYVGEAVGRVSVRVGRSAGSLGEIAMPWHVVPWSFDDGWGDAAVNATLGLDVADSSGVLRWADGDTSERTITVPVLEDSFHEPFEGFAIVLGNPADGTLIAHGQINFVIEDNDPGPPTPLPPVSTPQPVAVTPAAVPQHPASGGGGALGIWSLLGLLGLRAWISGVRRGWLGSRACGH